MVLGGLQMASATEVSLLLNLEMAATAALGVLVFREHLGRLGWLGVLAGLVAGALISLEGSWPGLKAGLLVAAACLAWGLDNHFTALIDAVSPAEATVCKGLGAGATNLLLGLALESAPLRPAAVLAALAVGSLSFGLSIVLYVLSAQHLGATRAQAAFASAPFMGAGLSFAVLGEPVGWEHLAAAALLVAGVVLLVVDRHEHAHTHPALEHVHSHRHDDGHHLHEHPGLPRSVRHTHAHHHEALSHSHRHLPDLHHRHAHGA
jgi:drug/metabolite transporter (DMT)-like permease